MPKCAHCKETTSNRFALTYACDYDCAAAVTEVRRAKAAMRAARKAEAERKAQDRADKVRIKKRSEWMAEAQAAFNAYIRERDRDLPCISCGTFNPNIQYCAGHYLTRGAHPELSFEPRNVHKQCNKNCNLHLSGNQQQYRIGLLMRIGAEKVAWLEGPHEPKKYTIDDLAAIKAEYRAKLCDLKRSPVYAV